MNSAILILVLGCLGIAQALFLCLYLFSLKKGNRKAHFFLALIILGLTIRIGKSILNEYIQLEAWQRNLGIAGILMVGPSIWYYGKSVFHHFLGSPKHIFLHFVPYLLFSLCCAFIPNRFDTLSLGIYYAVFAHLFIYLVLSIKLGLDERHQSQKTVVVWYRNLVIGVGLIWLFYIGNVSGLIPFYIGGAICYTFLVYIFSFLLLKKHSFQLEKYKGQALDKNVSDDVMYALNQLFTDESIYLSHQITLSEVAKKVGATPKILSRVINETSGKNFSEFVNSYRIEKAKSLLTSSDSEREKIASIAYDSGFNNVTSFNLAFKELTKLTPSEYRKKFK